MESRKRKRLLVALAGIVAFVTGLLLFLNHNPEPTYNGRPLSEWVRRYNDNSAPPLITGTNRTQALEAIRAIGTNGLPWLLHAINYEHQPWRNRLDGYLAPRLPPSVGSRATSLIMSRSSEATHAVYAFTALGSLAAPAVPELARRIMATNTPDESRFALYAVAATGEAGVPVMQAALELERYASSMWTPFCISVMGEHAKAMIPILVKNLERGDINVTGASVACLRAIGEQPAILATLPQCLSDENVTMRREAARALGMYGTDARTTMPALIKLLNDADAEVRATAAAAIRLIDPSALPDEFRTPASPP